MKRIFSSVPILPRVPVPQAGESLAGWVTEICWIYRVTPATYLGRLGFEAFASAMDSHLTVQPHPRLLRALQEDTGVNLDVLEDMTFFGLPESLQLRCASHKKDPCRVCAAEAEIRAGRPVDLRYAKAAWRFSCLCHPAANDGDIHGDVPLAFVHDSFRRVMDVLDRAAWSNAVASTELFGIPVAAFIVIVNLLNDLVMVQIVGFDVETGTALFRSLNGQGQKARLLGPRFPRRGVNHKAISVLLAWQLLDEKLWTLESPGCRQFGGLQFDEWEHKDLIKLLREIYELLYIICPDYRETRKYWFDDGGRLNYLRLSCLRSQQ